ncbi:MAG: enoyl-CoA hydratase/isomerase family protein [Candidatus Obscuribacterales bacterium]|jgi:3-hydroxyacyl-CoA dehydrogenase/enoyl-CoA hydratase/3-hydroxybutyryl-CoA epimerase|nr:enoyl-CoA hydratase/isomerase family protein [Candidatus Obscuribacterales bacterium]
MTNNTAERKRELTTIKRPSGVALILFDSTAKYNSLGAPVRIELDETLDHIAKDDSIVGIICISGKHDSFIIGADIQEIRKCESKEEVHDLCTKGQILFDKLNNFPKPAIAAINGSCLGGGVELALACHKRIATTEKHTIFAMPETRLGLIPGLGGTQRLPLLIGLKAALDMILSSSTISAEEAHSLGLIDELVESANLIESAEKMVLEYAKSDEWKQRSSNRAAGVKATPQCKVELEPEKAQKLLAISERAIKLRTKGNYPAQIEAIKVIREGLTHGYEKGLIAESNAFAELASGEVSANLISLYLNTEFAKSSAQAMVQKINGSQVKTLGLVGAGVMGIGLAERAAAAGIKVLLKTKADKMDAVKEELRQLAQRSAQHNKSDSPAEKESVLQTILDRISLVSEQKDLDSADLILESIIEDESAKKELLSQFSKQKDSLILATGTSSLSVKKLSESVEKPENFIGIHFFHPVALMPLVELISHPGTAKQTLARAMDLVLKLDKTPIVVKDSPGFLINRLLTVYLFEVARLAGEGKPLNWLEETMLEFGMPMGPIQLMDEIGIDVSFTVANTLEEGFGERMKSPEIFHKARAIGLQGKRSNVGLYLWEGGEKRVKINPDLLEKTGAVWTEEKCPEDEKVKLTERMLYPMIDEAARCLEEKVISRPREIDFALILGIGFPAFRGGLLRYADTRGLRQIVTRLEEIYSESAARGTSSQRQVSSLLKNYAESGRSFYSLAGAKE